MVYSFESVIINQKKMEITRQNKNVTARLFKRIPTVAAVLFFLLKEIVVDYFNTKLLNTSTKK
jgi:hypothetical protein